jgi:hypothetical protein
MIMKNIQLTVVLALVIFTFAFSGCTKDSSTSPDSTTRDSFIGNWLASPLKSTYDVTISADPNSSDGVFIANFNLIGFSYPPASASVSGNKITLDANQVIGSGITVNGSGTLSGTKITWTYTTFDGADLTTVNETYTKQ